MVLVAIEIVIRRLSVADLTIPSIEAWLNVVVLLLLYASVALPFGFWGQFLDIETLQASWRVFAGITAKSFIMPGVVEEILFRVVWLPHPSEHPSASQLWLWGAIALVLFVVYHPLNGLTLFRQGRKVFFNGIFLVLAALLGIVCSIAYCVSGSLWTPVVIHWLVVVIWLLFLGGYRKLELGGEEVKR